MIMGPDIKVLPYLHLYFETFNAPSKEKVVFTQIIKMQGKSGKWFRKSLRWNLRES